MTDHDLDQSYTSLCEAMAAVGEAKAPLLLSMLCLSLLSRFDHAGEVLALIANAKARLEEDGAPGQQT